MPSWTGSATIFRQVDLDELFSNPAHQCLGMYLLIAEHRDFQSVVVGIGANLATELRHVTRNNVEWSWGICIRDVSRNLSLSDFDFIRARVSKLTSLKVGTTVSETVIPNPNGMTAQFLAKVVEVLKLLGVALDPKNRQEESFVIDGMSTVDTIVVPARAEGFNQRFLSEHCWYAVRISAVVLPQLRYIAAYQVAPIAAVTHIAEIDSVEPYGTTGKFLIRFRGKAKSISPIPRADAKRISLQSPRYTTSERIKVAKTLKDLFTE